MKKLYLAMMICLACSVFAQISLTTMNVEYTQNFDGLVSTGTGSTTLTENLTGWSILETGSAANTSYTAANGSSGSGDTYSYGAAGDSDRALGAVASTNLTSRWGAHFKNDTGYSINQLLVSYTGEEWRMGSTGRTTQDQIIFEISTDAVSLSTGTWTTVSGLSYMTTDISGNAGARNGNNDNYRSLISSTITELNIAPGEHFWIRFVDVNIPGNDDGLAVDDFSLTPQNSSYLGTAEHFISPKSFLKETMVTNELIFGIKAEVKIYDINGKLVKKALVTPGISLDISGLKSGAYIVAGTSESQFLSVKIIKL
ncbi:T9SS type A sorting domain-containing protein [Chryseobacterium sp. MYb264]|uniref:T9SS type A sorting domain-containing protein n=1 Tax=Chryseobacterium sp. MYb264 TaxID=2745153 RepID=UPI002E100339|nr:T9SS type A sorting domain-containing protein [Chryseobacterium sp. MYb264]